MKTNPALFNEALKKLFCAIADREGITVRFEDDCEDPHASKYRVITLPPPSAVAADRYWYYCFHELGHLLKEMDWSYGWLLEALNEAQNELALSLANIILDNVEEANFFGLYEGVDDILDSGRANFTLEHYLGIKDAQWEDVQENDPVSSLVYAVLFEDMEQRKTWMGTHMETLPSEAVTDKFLKKMTRAVREVDYYGRVGDIIHQHDPGKATLDLVNDLLDILDIPPVPPPEGSGEGEGEGEGGGEPCKACEGSGKGDDGEPCEVCGGSGKEPKKCTTCRGEGEGKDGEPCEDCGGTGKEPPPPPEEMRESTKDQDDAMGNDGKGFDFDMKGVDLSADGLKEVLAKINEQMTKRLDRDKGQKDRIRGWARHESSVAEYTPWAKNNIHVLEKTHTRFRPKLRVAIESALGDSSVSKQVSKYLKAMVSESYTYGQRRGKIHQKNLHKVITGKVSPGVPPPIYKRRNTSVLKTDSAVSLLLDCSGSMSGSKYAIGAACCVAISETLTSIGVPHEILGFSEQSTLESYIFKNFGTTFTKDKTMNVMAHSSVSLSNNADGESVMWAAERLLMRKESRKLLIVLSDGMPAGSFSGNGNAYLKHVCNMIEEESPIDLVGIGIATTAVRSFYKDNVVVHNPKELDATLFSVLKKFLI